MTKGWGLVERVLWHAYIPVLLVALNGWYWVMVLYVATGLIYLLITRRRVPGPRQRARRESLTTTIGAFRDGRRKRHHRHGNRTARNRHRADGEVHQPPE